ncbi:hypothetical protein H8R18_03865 [Nanchangia anserum]|uniref:Uncharacterized protein n=1 Tax=Nanchangia anserum TaxID=2692125 RepID=A0A8I0G6I6_9ACTO|nr:hypothetical protein [Nanchangia anserum]MBD3688697.1 hypothetical protein [Nanchangia anserum]QOX82445.1 hypothetical protein H8R18_03865 [Nanchangia anserum]
MTLFNVEESGTGRQANNVFAASIPEAVRPWFADVAHNSRVARALSALGSASEGERRWAQDVLGVSIRPAAV